MLIFGLIIGYGFYVYRQSLFIVECVCDLIIDKRQSLLKSMGGRLPSLEQAIWSSLGRPWATFRPMTLTMAAGEPQTPDTKFKL